MKKYIRIGLHRNKVKMCKKLPAVLFLIICVVLYMMSSGKITLFSKSAIKNIALSTDSAEKILAIELGIELHSDKSILQKVFSVNNFLYEEKQENINSTTTEEKEENIQQSLSDEISYDTQKENADVLQEQTEQKEALSDIGKVDFASAESVELHNSTGYSPDIAALLNESLPLSVNEGMPQVLIIHTHSSEAYTGEYEASDYFRTEDRTQSVIRVGDELAEAFSQYGIKVLHDRNIYDYPSYTGSYNRTMESVQKYLEKYPSIAMVIDLHRDALQNPDGTEYRTDAEIEGEDCAQLMLVVGTGESGLAHPNWESNLALAVHLQAAAEYEYQHLFRPIAITKERYNQHLSSGSLILEVGSTGNTLDEAINAVYHFAEISSKVLMQYMQ